MSYPPGPYEGSPEWQGQQPPAWQGQQPPAWQGQPPPPGYPVPQQGWPAQREPDNYLVWAILVTVLCCLPFGIVSIVYAAQVNNKWAMGDVTGAHASSQKAKQFAIWSALTSVILTVLFIVLIVVLSAVGSSQS
jgi:ABC-type Fe3+ transport system permease subunit